MSHWRTRFIMMVVLLVGVFSMFMSASPALADAPGITIGANNCPVVGAACIKDVYQDEITIWIEFTALPSDLNFDFYNLRWAVGGDWTHASQIQTYHGAAGISPVSIGVAYTFIVEGCRSHLGVAYCGSWSNQVTVITTAPTITQRGVLNAVSAITMTPNGDGYFQAYNNHVWVYCQRVWVWNTAAQNSRYQCQNAYVIGGAIFDKWSTLPPSGWERSFLGFPITDELTTPDGMGRYNHFQGGSIYWTPSLGAHEIHGTIRDKWASMGWERSCLGYPTTDVQPTSGGSISYFQHGYILATASGTFAYC